jgi:hypothetical protein
MSASSDASNWQAAMIAGWGAGGRSGGSGRTQFAGRCQPLVVRRHWERGAEESERVSNPEHTAPHVKPRKVTATTARRRGDGNTRWLLGDVPRRQSNRDADGHVQLERCRNGPGNKALAKGLFEVRCRACGRCATSNTRNRGVLASWRLRASGLGVSRSSGGLRRASRHARK